MFKTILKIRRELKVLEAQECLRQKIEEERRNAIAARIKATYDNSTKVFNLGLKG